MMKPVAEEPLSADEVTPREAVLDKGEELCSPKEEPDDLKLSCFRQPEMKSAPPKTFTGSKTLDI